MWELKFKYRGIFSTIRYAFAATIIHTYRKYICMYIVHIIIIEPCGITPQSESPQLL